MGIKYNSMQYYLVKTKIFGFVKPPPMAFMYIYHRRGVNERSIELI